MNKRLGQHFLHNKKIVNDIIDAAKLSRSDIVLEVGPGRGVLTEALAKTAKKVIAVEKDPLLVGLLKNKFENQKNIEIIAGDILAHPSPLTPRPYKIVANIPYYVTSRFLRMFLSQAQLRPSLMVLMVQREVAERIVARDGKESLLSLSVKAYGKPEIVKIVRRGNFSPPPKVDSAIIKIDLTPPAPLSLVRRGGKKRDNDPSLGEEIETILALARSAFQQKRKMLKSSIGKKINLPTKYQTKRPEELKLEDWAAICLSR